MAAAKEKTKVQINHLRGEYDLATRRRAEASEQVKILANQPASEIETTMMNRMSDPHGVVKRETDRLQRIKTINAALGSGDNALTSIRLRGSPMALLIDKGSAKAEEMMAAQEIETAFFAISGALMFKPISMEKVDRSHQAHNWSGKTSLAVRNYQAWANHWSDRKKQFLDHTMECVIAAVIDQRPVRVIAQDLGFGHAKIANAVINGLRDYAARAGWVDGRTAGQWMAAAEMTFKPRAA
jgi:hypothetical protein